MPKTRNAGDVLVSHIGLTSARWQMLGAVALSAGALTAPQIGSAMGVTRQGAQKQLNVLVAVGLMEQVPNPAHKRSPLYALTTKGQAVYEAADRVQAKWANGLVAGLTLRELETTRRVLGALSESLTHPQEGCSDEDAHPCLRWHNRTVQIGCLSSRADKRKRPASVTPAKGGLRDGHLY